MKGLNGTDLLLAQQPGIHEAAAVLALEQFWDWDSREKTENAPQVLGKQVLFHQLLRGFVGRLIAVGCPSKKMRHQEPQLVRGKRPPSWEKPAPADIRVKLKTTAR